MSVMIDQRPLSNPRDLQTVGDVLDHITRSGRIVVDILIDGRQPELELLDDLRHAELAGMEVHVQTADARDIALDTLRDASQLIDSLGDEAAQAVEDLAGASTGRAFARLSSCFGAWHQTHEAVVHVARLMRVDMRSIDIAGESLTDWLARFASQLHDIRSALQQQDYVLLRDVLQYEASDTSEKLRAALGALHERIAA